jgi:hypothetical protein
MISEKTVELNLTTQLINCFYYVTGQIHYALAPSQRQEGQLGFDVSVTAPGGGVLIQYKRALRRRRRLDGQPSDFVPDVSAREIDLSSDDSSSPSQQERATLRTSQRISSRELRY